MTPNQTLPEGGDALATSLRQLAQRAYEVLKQGRPEGRDEVNALLDEIARSKELAAGVAGEDLGRWLDGLERQVAEQLDAGVAPAAVCGGVGLAS